MLTHGDRLSDDDGKGIGGFVLDRFVPEINDYILPVYLSALVGGTDELIDVVHNAALFHAALHLLVACNRKRTHKRHDGDYDQQFHQGKTAFHCLVTSNESVGIEYTILKLRK